MMNRLSDRWNNLTDLDWFSSSENDNNTSTKLEYY